MRTLDRKVLRDLRQMGSQALTIALVIGSGIGGFVGCLSAVDSLAAARDAFYESGRFAEVFVTLKRAPNALAETLRTLPGISAAQTTVETVARVSMPASTDPVLGQFIGLDAARPATLNRVSLRSGRWPQALGSSELQAVVSEGFATAQGLQAGGAVQALINGAPAAGAHHRHCPVARIHLCRLLGHARCARLWRLLGRPAAAGGHAGHDRRLQPRGLPPE